MKNSKNFFLQEIIGDLLKFEYVKTMILLFVILQKKYILFPFLKERVIQRLIREKSLSVCPIQSENSMYYIHYLEC